MDRKQKNKVNRSRFKKIATYAGISLLMPFVYTFGILFGFFIMPSMVCIEAWKKLTKMYII